MFCTFSRVVLAVTAIVLVGFGARATLAQTPIEQPAPKPAAQAAADLTEKTKKAKPVESDIFQTIWNLPESHVVVTTLDKNGKPLDPKAKVAVNEQGKGGNCLNEDNAPLPLLSHVDETIFDEPSFKTFIALLDNYTAAEQEPEVTFEKPDDPHWKEVDAFMDTMFSTKTVQVAVEHIQKELAPGTSTEAIRAAARKMWFQPYTNRYREAVPFCVGFEHVFVGEDESNKNGAPKCQDRVAGYHSWVKFYLDEKAGKANYLGYDYPDGNVPDALKDKKVTTLLMRWTPDRKTDGGFGNDLLKKPGGFFIGTRPELEFSFGVLAMYSQKAGKYSNVRGKQNHHRVRLGKNYFDLVMHPHSLSSRERGEHIRTLYPKFRGETIPGSGGSVAGARRGSSGPSSRRGSNPVAGVDLPTQPLNNAPIQIARALPNTDKKNDEGEWVELVNRSESTVFDMTKWHLSDQRGRKKSLMGELKPGQTLRVYLERVDQNSMMLKNAPGWILLFEGDERRAAVRYEKPQSEVIVDFRE